MFTSRHMLVVLTIGVVFVLAQGTAVAGTVAYWEFNNDLTDSSGNSHTGVATDGNIGVQYVTEGSTTALVQAGGVSDVTIPGSSQFQFSGDGGCTIEARVRIDSGYYKMFIDDTASTGGPGWWLRATNSGLLQSDVYDGSGEREVSGTTNIADSAWHQVAVVFNGTADTLSLYVDHNLETLTENYTNDTALASTFGTSSDIRIGVNHSGGQPVYGAIDYIRVSDVALSPSEFVGVPEPSAIVLLTTAVLGLLAYAWRKRG
jgi:hypothetical protein